MTMESTGSCTKTITYINLDGSNHETPRKKASGTIDFDQWEPPTWSQITLKWSNSTKGNEFGYIYIGKTQKGKCVVPIRPSTIITPTLNTGYSWSIFI
jgi:hypothetical protein